MTTYTIEKRFNNEYIVCTKMGTMKEYVGKYKSEEEAELAGKVAAKWREKERKWIARHRIKLHEQIEKELAKKLAK